MLTVFEEDARHIHGLRQPRTMPRTGVLFTLGSCRGQSRRIYLQLIKQAVSELTSFRTVCMTCRMRRAIATVSVCSLLLFCFATLSSAHKRKSTQVPRLPTISLQLVWVYCNSAFPSCLLTQSELLVVVLGTREPLSLRQQCLCL